MRVSDERTNRRSLEFNAFQTYTQHFGRPLCGLLVIVVHCTLPHLPTFFFPRLPHLYIPSRNGRVNHLGLRGSSSPHDGNIYEERSRGAEGTSRRGSAVRGVCRASNVAMIAFPQLLMRLLLISYYKKPRRAAPNFVSVPTRVYMSTEVRME